MLKATDFEILRGIRPGRTHPPTPLARKPLRVALLLNEDMFTATHLLIHRVTVYLEDEMHDWSWSDGMFRYCSTLTDKGDLVIVYANEDASSKACFDPFTGKPLTSG